MFYYYSFIYPPRRKGPHNVHTYQCLDIGSRTVRNLWIFGFTGPCNKLTWVRYNFRIKKVARQSGLLGHYLSCNENLCCDTFPPVAVVCKNIIDTACDFLATRVTSIPGIHTTVRQALVYQISRRVNDFHVAVAS